MLVNSQDGKAVLYANLLDAVKSNPNFVKQTLESLVERGLKHELTEQSGLLNNDFFRCTLTRQAMKINDLDLVDFLINFYTKYFYCVDFEKNGQESGIISRVIMGFFSDRDFDSGLELFKKYEYLIIRKHIDFRSSFVNVFSRCDDIEKLEKMVKEFYDCMAHWEFHSIIYYFLMNDMDKHFNAFMPFYIIKSLEFEENVKTHSRVVCNAIEEFLARSKPGGKINNSMQERISDDHLYSYAEFCLIEASKVGGDTKKSK
jgi:hypothetical protein